jgi:hypothetical protein
MPVRMNSLLFISELTITCDHLRRACQPESQDYQT